MKNRPVVPATEVLSWLEDNYPELAAKAEVERSWVWLAEVNLSGDHNKATRESLKLFGFVFKNPKRGAHKLPSGRTSNWAHHGEKPIPFRKGGSKEGSRGAGKRDREPGRATVAHPLDEQLGLEIDKALASLGLG